MFFHQRGTLGNQTAPMDEPFLIYSSAHQGFELQKKYEKRNQNKNV